MNGMSTMMWRHVLWEMVAVVDMETHAIDADTSDFSPRINSSRQTRHVMPWAAMIMSTMLPTTMLPGPRFCLPRFSTEDVPSPDNF